MYWGLGFFVNIGLPLQEICPPVKPGRFSLTRFLDDGSLELDTNPVENQIRPIALTRKNALFAGNEVGAENWAMLASLVATCKISSVNPVDYLDATLRAILDGHPKSRIDDLMPWRYAQPSSLAAKGHAVALTSLGAILRDRRGAQTGPGRLRSQTQRLVAPTAPRLQDTRSDQG